SFHFSAPVSPPYLHSLPTRRSSDLRWCSPPRSPIHPSYHFATVSQLVRAPGLRFRTLRPTCASPSAGATRERDESRQRPQKAATDRKSTRLNSSHGSISYAVFCLKK